MPKGNGVDQEPLSPDSLLSDTVCVCCEALTKLLVQKGVISWEELLTVAKTATIERKSEKRSQPIYPDPQKETGG